MINFKTKNKVNLPKFDFSDDLKFVSDKIVIPGIAGRIQKGTDLRDKKYPALDPKTVKNKGHNDPLIGRERLLFKSFKSKSKGRNERKIFIDARRREVANILQNIGVKSKKFGRRKFNFFGVNTEMERDAIKYMKEKIRRKL